MLTNTDFDTLVEAWQEVTRSHSIDGDSGVSNFESLCKTLGYPDIKTFLSNNPRAIERLIEFVIEYGVHSEEWQQKVSNAIHEIDENIGTMDSDECLKAKKHLSLCDNDGFCLYCGEQD